MNDDKMKKIFDRAKQKSGNDSKHKNNLRRELLNSDLFEKRKENKKRFSYSAVLASVMTILISIYFLNVFTVNENLKKNLLEKMDAYYSGYSLPDNWFHNENDLSAQTAENQPFNLKIEQYVNGTGDSARLIIKDLNNEVVDEYIINGKKVYRTLSPKIKFSGIDNSFSTAKVKSIIYDTNYTATNIDSITSRHIDSMKSMFNKMEVEVKKYNSKGKIIYSNTGFGNEIKNSGEIEIEIDSKNDFHKYFSITVNDIYSTIKNSDSIVVTESEWDDSLNTKCSIIVMSESISKKDIQELILTISADSISDIHGLFKTDSIITESFTLSANIDSLLPAIESVESYSLKRKIKINPETGKILKIEFGINGDNKLTKLAAITFGSKKIDKVDKSLIDINNENFEFYGFRLHH